MMAVVRRESGSAAGCVHRDSCSLCSSRLLTRECMCMSSLNEDERVLILDSLVSVLLRIREALDVA